MINKLIVLNGTEGHFFEVGQPYLISGYKGTVSEILSAARGHQVMFEDGSLMNIFTPNVLTFMTPHE
ncbi:hypothetical protein [Bacillus infantis]|uniref:hypothetical protein n=1 Tax=Bacillus infantis TaxID=324767 RepID=UPI003CF0BC3F